MKFGSLFSGIGGMDLGLERAGMECAWQVEIDEFCRKVLTKHWPNVPKFNDVRECGKHNLEPVDLIAGGFPCQDISVGNQAGQGLEGERSGLWSEMFRIISELRPGFALVENVANLFNRGIERVLGNLAGIGYDAEWQVIPASAVGAPHTRSRVFIVAYPASLRRDDGGCVWERRPVLYDFNGDAAQGQPQGQGRECWPSAIPSFIAESADPNGGGLQGRVYEWSSKRVETLSQGELRWNLPTPYVCRGSDGIPDRAVQWS